jgi:hypothetical protein
MPGIADSAGRRLRHPASAIARGSPRAAKNERYQSADREPTFAFWLAIERPGDQASRLQAEPIRDRGEAERNIWPKTAGRSVGMVCGRHRRKPGGIEAAAIRGTRCRVRPGSLSGFGRRRSSSRLRAARALRWNAETTFANCGHNSSTHLTRPLSRPSPRSKAWPALHNKHGFTDARSRGGLDSAPAATN